jgi:hypothetical protein
MRKLISKWHDLVAWWENKSPQEQGRLRSFIPWILYAVAVLYGVVYLSILNSVNRYKTGTTVKTWFGGDLPEIQEQKMKQAKDIKDSFKKLRKRVSGNR